MRKAGGFTIIEIVTVMGIAGLLILLAIIGAQYAVAYSTDQNIKQAIVQLNQIIEDYHSMNAVYPSVVCPGSGFDNTGDLTSLQTALASPPLSPADQSELTSIINTFTNNGFIAQGKVGYCSSPQPSGAYLLIVKTATPQVCTDANKNNYFIIGSGSYQNSGGGDSQYYNLPQDMNLPSIQNGPSYSINCFNK